MTTLKAQIASDAANLIMNTDETAEAVSAYTPKSGDAVASLNVVMNRNNFAAEFDVSGEDWNKTASVYILRSDVDQPGRGDKFTASDGTWEIASVVSQNVAGTTCTVLLRTKVTAGHIKKV